MKETILAMASPRIRRPVVVRGRIEVITGAAGGMGAEFIRHFLDNGDSVITADMSDEAPGKLAATPSSDRLHVRSANLTDEGATGALASAGGSTGEPHVFPANLTLLGTAREAIDGIGAFLRRHLADPDHSDCPLSGTLQGAKA